MYCIQVRWINDHSRLATRSNLKYQIDLNDYFERALCPVPTTVAYVPLLLERPQRGPTNVDDIGRSRGTSGHTTGPGPFPVLCIALTANSLANSTTCEDRLYSHG